MWKKTGEWIEEIKSPGHIPTEHRVKQEQKKLTSIPRVNFTTRRVRFLACSSVIPFLCLRRKGSVHEIWRGLFLLWKSASDLLDRK